MLRFTTLLTKAHFNEIPDIIIIIIIIIVIIVIIVIIIIIVIIVIVIVIVIVMVIIIIIIIIIISHQKRNRNARELFYTEHDQRFFSTRKGRKIQIGLSRHFCPIKLASSGNLEYPLNFSVTFT